ncbi:SDR family oxidoreductase [Falsochrobactrum ovis]|uniref:Nucleoside-diphosphate-sugar epimerase n=1 Tax=Falsochrobactrum ovis TaxID=1293442 RepID=A0A364JUF1_9HYPH|nr:SDR family oxidoreductase [Falsochrobactrum ovis]RAK28125.1 nucleoside-diphosphate-sugar epimerase [Falsochrobactrum ovis]
MRIFLLGAGYSALAFARLIADKSQSIIGTTRSTENFASLKKAGITPILFNGETLQPDLLEALSDASHIVVSIAPQKNGDPALPVVESALTRPENNIKWIGYLSTVGVYGDHKGHWVDEDTPCNPISSRSIERLQAEQAWEALGQRFDLPVARLRLSGIYGPGRNAFINLERGTARRIVKNGQIFNRIHVDDIAGALQFLSARGAAGIFNVTDNEPTPPQDVVTYAAQLMAVTPPEEIPFERAEMSPMARSFYGENKRVSNQRLKSLGYDFIYPDYRIALSAMWNNANWR